MCNEQGISDYFKITKPEMLNMLLSPHVPTTPVPAPRLSIAPTATAPRVSIAPGRLPRKNNLSQEYFLLMMIC